MACISGFTIGGYYNYIDCCGNNQTGLSAGLQDVCVDVAYSGTAIGVILDSGSTCTIDCNQGPLSYNFQVTGICSAATGSVIINSFGGIPPYTIDPITPEGSGLSAQTSSTPITYTGLTGGTYVFRMNDSLGLQNNELYINVNISDCFVAEINDISGTTCGLDNGYFSVSASSTSSPYTILLYKDGTLNQFNTTNTLPYEYPNLGSGIYYADIYDYGYSTAKTENVVISGSTGVDFGFWKVNTSTCVIDQGKIAVTGITGNPPYSYLWNNGETGQLITGLTKGTYSCTITDSLGCETTKSEIIGEAEPLGVGLISSTNPSCFLSDGTLSFTITGGTRPLYYSSTTSQIGYTFGDTFTITDLSTGSYGVNVRDANFCELNLTGFVSPKNGFDVVNTVINNSNCSQNNGSVSVEIAGLSGFYSYALSGQNTGDVYLNTSQNQSYTFNNLTNDSYLLIISGSGNDCVYVNTVSVNSEQKFSVSATTTGSTCGEQNGVIQVQVSSGYTGVLDYILSNGQTLINTSLTSYTFNNLSNGIYSLKVVDEDGCEISQEINLISEGNLVTSIKTTNCTTGNNGVAQVVIYQGEPTFTYEWSDNVPGTQTGSTVTGLTSGDYEVVITDSNGCKNTQKFNIICESVLVQNYEIYTLCEDTFTTTTGNKRGFGEMLNEGFIDITSGYTDCYFSSATFTCNININGSAHTQTFYTATTLNDVPEDTDWITTIEGVLSSISEVGTYSVDVLNNNLQVKSNCNGDDDPLGGKSISIGLTITYDVYCLEPA